MAILEIQSNLPIMFVIIAIIASSMWFYFEIRKLHYKIIDIQSSLKKMNLGENIDDKKEIMENQIHVDINNPEHQMDGTISLGDIQEMNETISHEDIQGMNETISH